MMITTKIIETDKASYVERYKRKTNYVLNSLPEKC